MAELLPHKLGLLKALPNDGQARPFKVRCCTVTNILEWTQYFAIHILYSSGLQKDGGLYRHYVIEFQMAISKV